MGIRLVSDGSNLPRFETEAGVRFAEVAAFALYNGVISAQRGSEGMGREAVDLANGVIDAASTYLSLQVECWRANPSKYARRVASSIGSTSAAT